MSAPCEMRIPLSVPCAGFVADTTGLYCSVCGWPQDDHAHETTLPSAPAPLVRALRLARGALVSLKAAADGAIEAANDADSTEDAVRTIEIRNAIISAHREIADAIGRLS